MRNWKIGPHSRGVHRHEGEEVEKWSHLGVFNLMEEIFNRICYMGRWIGDAIALGKENFGREDYDVHFQSVEAQNG